MKLWMVSFTARGRETAAALARAASAAGHSVRTFALPKFCAGGDEPLTCSVADWAAAGFQAAEGLIFCCAAGIAVRAIAPWVRDKAADPAVLAADELGRYVIPLLCGHLGGANGLAEALARAVGAAAVITTATDLNGVFAVDVFAARNHLLITDMALAKAVSAALLAGEQVGFVSDLPWEGPLPRGLTTGAAALGVCVCRDRGRAPFARTLHLIPRRYAAGMGCKRGKSAEALEGFLLEQLERRGISVEELRCIATLDRKGDEPGLLALCRACRLPLLTYTAAELSAVPGTFHASAFVRSQTGVDSVCERAAVLASGGPLVVEKTASEGMTFALAEYREGICFG